ncbi:type IX secretion system protein PorQ [Balneola sp. MJW-20]|uniref:type IX secretion system protein PorQ n=1 Tax=Gracilimonas aurantiaca TaxID=3234185 RepID=UPI0034665927
MRFILFNAVLLLAASKLCAQSNNSAVFRFLDVIPTAKAAALGGNHPGLYNADFSLMNVNPAYMSQENSGYWSATYINYLADANMAITNAAWHVEDLGTLGVSLRYVGYGDLERYDDAGNAQGSFNASDIALTGSFSRQLSPRLSIGSSVDLIYSSYLTYRSNAVALSGGLLYTDKDQNFSAGMTIRNAGTQISTFDRRREPLPLDISVGITKKPEAFPFALSLSLRKLNDWDLRVVGEKESPEIFDNILRHVIFGGEAKLGENLDLRFGYDHYLHEQTSTDKNIDLAGFAFGVGIKIRTFRVDISRNAYSRIGGMTQLSIKTQLW